MGDPFKPEADLPFPTSSSVAIKDGQIYLEQPNMLQVEDIEDFTQPIFVEIKPLLSFSMDEDTDNPWNVPTRSGELNEAAVRAEGGDVSPLIMLDPGHDLNLGATANPEHCDVPMIRTPKDKLPSTSKPAIINPSLLNASDGESTEPARVHAMDEWVFHGLPFVLQQDAAPVNLDRVDFAPVSAPGMEHVLNEALEQDKATVPLDTFVMDVDSAYPAVQDSGSTHSVFLDEPIDVVPRPETPGDAATSYLNGTDEDGSFEHEPVAPQVGSGLSVEPGAATHENVERESRRIGHLDDINTSAVEIPTSAVVDDPATQAPRPAKHDKKLKIAKSEKMMEHLKNPKVKKDQACVLNADTVSDRLQQIGFEPFPIALPKSTTDATFQRDFLSHHYGGNMRATFPVIRRDKIAATGLDDFMYINLRYNPHAPEVPGMPGLWYTVGQGRSIVRAYPWAKEQRVVSRLAEGIWQYQGQYVLIPADSLTKEEWGAQDVKLRNTWVQEIRERQWGRPTRARIALCARFGRPPTGAELDAALQSDSKYNEITSAQIARALLEGEETMAVWAMKCVGYDENFQQGLIEKQKTWVSPSKKTKKGTKKTVPKPGRSSKRKSEGFDSARSSVENFSDDDEVQVISRIKSRAMQRRSRHAAEVLL